MGRKTNESMEILSFFTVRNTRNNKKSRAIYQTFNYLYYILSCSLNLIFGNTKETWIKKYRIPNTLKIPKLLAVTTTNSITIGRTFNYYYYFKNKFST